MTDLILRDESVKPGVDEATIVETKTGGSKKEVVQMAGAEIQANIEATC